MGIGVKPSTPQRQSHSLQAAHSEALAPQGLGEKNGPDNEASANNLKKGHDGFEKTVSPKIAQQKTQNARARDHLPSKADLVAQKCNNTHKVHLFSHNLEISVKRDFFLITVSY